MVDDHDTDFAVVVERVGLEIQQVPLIGPQRWYPIRIAAVQGPGQVEKLFLFLGCLYGLDDQA